MTSWSRTSETKKNGLGWSASNKINNKSKLEDMSKNDNAEKAPKKVVKKVVKKVAAKPTKKADKKADKKATAKKGPGVIASILEFVQAGPVKESAIVKKLVKRFPDKAEASMSKTVKAQIGSNKRPVRMEREKDITFVIVQDEKTKEKTYSVKA